MQLHSRRRTLIRHAPRCASLLALALWFAVGCADSDVESESPRAADTTRSGKPNVVLITLDTVRADALNAYGQALPSSPEIERIGREGVVFDRAFTSAPSTLPSHASILTARYPFANGVRSNAGYVLPQENVTLAEVLRQNGYATGAEIAAPVIARSTGLAQGFDHYRDPASSDVALIEFRGRDAGGDRRVTQIPERDAADINRFGRSFIRENRARPFFLWLHYFDAHQHYVPRPEYAKRLPDSPYHAEIRFVDDRIREVMATLAENDLQNDTIVVIVADHGEGLGEHHEDEHSYLVYDTTVRVPLIFWAPALLPAGTRIPAVVRTVDIAPTILDLLELPPLDGVQGASLLPLIRNPAEDPDRTAYGETIESALTFGGAALRYVRRGPWKYIHKVEPELYDVVNDPGERTNLAAVHPEEVAELRARLEEIVTGAPPPPGTATADIDAAHRAQLEALGYVVSDVDSDPAEFDSLEVRPPDPNAVIGDLVPFSQALAKSRAGFDDEAAEMLRSLVALHPASTPMYVELARVEGKLGQYAQAAETLEAALRVSPCSRLALSFRSQMLYLLGRRAEHLAMLRSARDRCPASARLLNDLAYVLATNPDAALRDGAEAVAAAQHAVALGGGENPEHLDTLAAAYAESGDFARAVETATRAVSLADVQHLPEQSRAGLRDHLALLQRGEPIRED